MKEVYIIKYNNDYNWYSDLVNTKIIIDENNIYISDLSTKYYIIIINSKVHYLPVENTISVSEMRLKKINFLYE